MAARQQAERPRPEDAAVVEEEEESDSGAPVCLEEAVLAHGEGSGSRRVSGDADEEGTAGEVLVTLHPHPLP